VMPPPYPVHHSLVHSLRYGETAHRGWNRRPSPGVGIIT
jgi:hypothetical protein